MDDVLYGAVCNNVVVIKYLSDAGFITRGLFSNNRAYIPDKFLIYKPNFYFECYEFFRNKKVRIKDQSKVLSASFDSPQNVRAGQIIYGECQPTKNFIEEKIKQFPELRLPFERGNIKNISPQAKANALGFFTGCEFKEKDRNLNKFIDDLICSEIFTRVPMEEMFVEFISKGDSPQSQWKKIIDLYIELSIQEIKSDKKMRQSEKESLVSSVRRAREVRIENMSSLSSATWPKQLMPRPNWFSYEI